MECRSGGRWGNSWSRMAVSTWRKARLWKMVLGGRPARIPKPRQFGWLQAGAYNLSWGARSLVVGLESGVAGCRMSWRPVVGSWVKSWWWWWFQRCRMNLSACSWYNSESNWSGVAAGFSTTWNVETCPRGVVLGRREGVGILVVR